MDDILSQEHWNELLGRLKQQFPELTDSDLQYHESMEQDMLKMVGFKLKKNINEMRGLFVGRHRISQIHHYLPLEEVAV